jgi:hypothetical protein
MRLAQVISDQFNRTKEDSMVHVTMFAATAITSGQAVRTTGSPTLVTPALDDLRTLPFLGVALQSVSAGSNVDVQVGGPFGALGAGAACAVGLDSSGRLVRAIDPSCISASNWIGDCDTDGTVTIRPRRETRLSVIDFGAKGDAATDDTPVLQAAIDCAAKNSLVEPESAGKVVYMPPGEYRITAPLVISNGCILEGAGLGVSGTTTIIADLVNGNFSLSNKTNIGLVGGENIHCAIALTGYWTGSAMNPDRGRADWAVLRQFRLSARPSQGPLATTLHQAPQMDGIRVMAHGPWIEKLFIESFRRNGITVIASYPPTFSPQINANNTQIRDCVISDNGQDGLYIAGDDANIMLIMNVDASGNGRDGINDRSFLGCTFVACHTSANQHRNYNCDRASSPTFSAYFGCYAEGDAPSVFKGNVTVVGGDVAFIHSDSHFYGMVPASSGPSWIGASNGISNVRAYPGQGAGYGITIDSDELHTPGNGYYYRAVSAGRTYGTYRSPPESAPTWPTEIGETVSEFGGLVWRCEGPYSKPARTFNNLGGVTPSVIQDYGYSKPDDTGIPFFRTERTSLYPVDGRLLTHLTSGVSFHSYFQTTYENGPFPGAILFPDVWVGSYYYGERRIGVSYTGTPFNSNTSSCAFYKPGDFILNATGPHERQGGIGWAVKASCGCGSAATDWSPGAHYHIGQTVKPSATNGRVYRLTSFKGGPSYPLSNVSGTMEPSWSLIVGQTTSDNHLEWETLYDLDDPANAWAIEPLPQRADAHADSIAENVADLRSDFNALLAKMRAANLLEP